MDLLNILKNAAKKFKNSVLREIIYIPNEEIFAAPKKVKSSREVETIDFEKCLGSHSELFK